MFQARVCSCVGVWGAGAGGGGRWRAVVGGGGWTVGGRWTVDGGGWWMVVGGGRWWVVVVGGEWQKNCTTGQDKLHPSSVDGQRPRVWRSEWGFVLL